MSWGGYIVPRGPTGHVARGTPGLAMRALTMVGNGAVRATDCLPPVEFELLVDLRQMHAFGAQKGVSYFELGCVHACYRTTGCPRGSLGCVRATLQA